MGFYLSQIHAFLALHESMIYNCRLIAPSQCVMERVVGWDVGILNVRYKSFESMNRQSVLRETYLMLLKSLSLSSNGTPTSYTNCFQYLGPGKLIKIYACFQHHQYFLIKQIII